MTDLPEPLVPADVDLRAFPFTPMFRARLFGSSFHAKATDAEWRAGVTLWLKSWDQMPAGTLPDDDVDLCRLAELGRDRKAWAKVKARALHGWVKCDDGRLHHAVVAEGVLEAWAKVKTGGRRGSAGAAAKWGLTELDKQNKLKRHERLAAARAKGTHTDEEWDALVEYCEGRCVICDAIGVEIVKDHILPIYQGGSDSIENLQPACRPCNARKGPDTTDHRPNGWGTSVDKASARTPASEEKTPALMPAKRLLTPDNRQGHREGQGEGEGYRTEPKKEELKIVSSCGSVAVNKKGFEKGSVTIEDPAERLEIFKKSLVPPLGGGPGAWAIIDAACDPNNPQFEECLATCKLAADKIKKGWAPQWPTRAGSKLLFDVNGFPELPEGLDAAKRRHA